MNVTAVVELPDGATLHYSKRPIVHPPTPIGFPPWAQEPGPAEPVFVINPFTLLDGACH